MGIKLGVTSVVTANKVQPCHLGQHCKHGGYIDAEEEYFQVTNNKIMPTGGMVTPEARTDGRADRHEDGHAPGIERRPVVLRQRYVVTRYHFDCLALYGEKLGTFKPFNDGVKGRPKSTVLESLPDDVKALRRIWGKERSRMHIMAINAPDPLKQLQYLQRAVDVTNQINSTGIPLHSQHYPAGYQALVTRHLCDAKARQTIHELGEDYHCIHCGKCYGASHVHV